MKIIILAAGKGERLMPLTMNTPKPLLDMGNGKTLLEEQIDSIKESHVIDEIILVVGYLAEQIEAKIKMHLLNGLKINIIYNPFYDFSNNLISLWMTLHEMDGDFLITNGDNLFSKKIFHDFVQATHDGIHLSINIKENYDFDDMKVTLHDHNLVSKVSKQIEDKFIHGESPGLALVRGERARKIFKNNLDRLVRNRESLQKYWLEIFNHLHDIGVPVYPWQFDGKGHWQEVDFHADITKIKEIIKLKIPTSHLN